MSDEPVRNTFTGMSSGVVIQARDAHIGRTVAYPLPHQLPSGTPVFVGRDQHLDQVDALADDAGKTARIAVVTGQPGVGKTALAVHWGHGAADRFPDGQLYVDLRGYDPSGESPP